MEWRGRANFGGVASKAHPKMTRIQPRREVKTTGGNYRSSGGDPGRFLCRDFDDNSLLSLRRLLLRSFRSREVVLLDLTLDLVLLVVVVLDVHLLLVVALGQQVVDGERELLVGAALLWESRLGSHVVISGGKFVFIVVVGLLTEDRRGFNLCHVGNGTNPFPVPAMASHRMSRGRRADGRRRKEEEEEEEGGTIKNS